MRKGVFAVMVLFASLAIMAMNLEARINFDEVDVAEIDMETLNISKQSFFSFIEDFVQSRPRGLGKYGRISFQACDYELEGLKLIDYNSPNGRGNEYLTNPSCDQLALRRVLQIGYDYTPENLGDYRNRKCILTVEKIFSPILEYYAIQYEEKATGDCGQCDQKEKNRLEKIVKVQKEINKYCDLEHQKINLFLRDLDQVVEKAYQTKK